jgi:hypothetical protein
MPTRVPTRTLWQTTNMNIRPSLIRRYPWHSGCRSSIAPVVVNFPASLGLAGSSNGLLLQMFRVL